MGRLSEIIWYLNEDTHPTELQIKHRYRYITIDDELKAIRRKYLSRKRKEANNIDVKEG